MKESSFVMTERGGSETDLSATRVRNLPLPAILSLWQQDFNTFMPLSKTLMSPCAPLFSIASATLVSSPSGLSFVALA